MDEEDYRALVEVMESELRGIGAEDVADERHYVRTDPETSEMRLLDPRERLIEMLRAFGRLLAIEDRAIYHRALGRMNERLNGDGPRGAVVARTTDDREAPPIDLGAAPELGMVRAELASLIGRLLDVDGGATPLVRE
jgi:hypothetical protein